MTTEASDLRIPIVAEEAHFDKRAVETRVRVRTVVDTRDQLLTDTLSVEALEIERRPVDQAVDATPPPRQDGDALIISVVEERLVVTKQLYVVEELVVRRRTSAEPVSATVPVRAMRAVIERDPTSQKDDH